jgi:glutathione S-transferase
VRDLGATFELIFAPRARAHGAARAGMSELVLHHYGTSPFSEKVRLVLGMKRLSWRSVTVPRIMPKPDVVALDRRLPAHSVSLQIGADIYCDSLLMCRVIDRLAPEPPLYPRESAGLAEGRRPMGRLGVLLDSHPLHHARSAPRNIFAGAPPST